MPEEAQENGCAVDGDDENAKTACADGESADSEGDDYAHGEGDDYAHSEGDESASKQQRSAEGIAQSAHSLRRERCLGAGARRHKFKLLPVSSPSKTTRPRFLICSSATKRR